MKKAFALILALAMMLSLLTACGSSSSGSAAASGSTAASDTEEASGTGAAASDTEEASGTGADASGLMASENEGTKNVTIGFTGTHDPSYPIAQTTNDFITEAMIYDRLFEVDDETGEYTSRVLESYEWTDSVTFKMTLKQGILFSDGCEMDGEDVLYSIEMVSRDSTDKRTVFCYIDFDKSYVDPDDPYTVYIVWQQEFGEAFLNMNIYIMDKEFTEAHEETDEIWYTDPVGSGPYKIVDMVHDSYITFEKRADYWNTDYTYDADQITLKFYTEETGMYVDYQNGVIDVMYEVSGNVVQQVQDAGNQGSVNIVPAGSVAELWFNDQNEYLANAKVREAICKAIDTQSIGVIAYGALYTPAHDFIPSTADAYVEMTGDTGMYDPEGAKAAMEESGYAEGEITLHVIAINDGTQPKLFEAVQANLASIGINLDIETMDMGTALPEMMAGNTDIQLMERHGGNPTAECISMVCGNDSSATFTCSIIHEQEYEDIVAKTKWTTDQDTINAGIKEMCDWLYANWRGIPLAEQTGAIVYNGRIASFNQCTCEKGCLGSLKLA